MPAKKQKAPAIHTVIATRDGLESALNRYVEVALSLIRRKAKQEKAIAELKAEHAKANKDDETEQLSLETGIQLFCTGHRKELLPDESESKSINFGNAVIGFRLNPHAVAKLVSKDSFERIAERLSALEWGDPYVITTYSVNKEGLLKDRADLTDAQLTEAGIAFVQDETFYIAPKSELLEGARKIVESEAAA